ncbi:MAG: hypothetical protein AAF357_02140, partial [Verrucomicrobiota bacterium]
FIGEDNRDLFLTTWDLVEDTVETIPLEADIDAAWVRGQILRQQGKAPVYGLVYDAGSRGGSGFNRFLSFPLEQSDRGAQR